MSKYTNIVEAEIIAEVVAVMDRNTSKKNSRRRIRKIIKTRRNIT